VWIARIPNAEYGPWSYVIPPAHLAAEAGWTAPHIHSLLSDGPAAMPRVAAGLAARLRSHDPSRRSGEVGRPRLEQSDPWTCRWAACLSDLRRRSDADIAGRLQNKGEERGARRVAARHVAAGRILLNAEGVLPWLLWPAGKVPTSWWVEPRFHEALRAWYHAYVAESRDVIDAAREAVRKGREAALAHAALRRAVDTNVATRTQQQGGQKSDPPPS
jgi:hypothetical protein